MARNVEIKARLESIDSVLDRVRSVADRGPVELHQDDTFFHCPKGRLKLRELSETEGQLIFYRRPDRTGPKESFYVLAPTQSPSSLRQALTLAYGELGRVRKRRVVYWAGRTRIHLDRVDKLGEFLELEVVLAEEEPTETGTAEAEALLAQLGIGPDALIDGAYLDLLMSDPSA